VTTLYNTVHHNMIKSEIHIVHTVITTNVHIVLTAQLYKFSIITQYHTQANVGQFEQLL